MNKRLIALFLCLVMMLSVVLVSCAEDSEEDAKSELEEAKVASNMTLTMWIVSEEPVSDSIRADVTKAINSLTKAKYKTQLEIQYLSEEEYFDKLTAAMEAYTATKKEQSANKPAETGTTNADANGTTVEEVVTDEHGMYRDNYPIVLENQVDIIYIGDVTLANGKVMTGEQMYNELRSDNWLAVLDDALKGDAKKIKEYVSPTLLSAVQEMGVTYAIPNNNVIGEYTYMCLNKEMIDSFSLDGYLTRGSIKNFYNEYIYQFLDMIAVHAEDIWQDKSILPIDATYEDCLAMLAYYWNIDPEDYSVNSDEFSIFGTSTLNSNPSRGDSAAEVESLFENEAFTQAYLKLNKYRMDQENVFFKSEGTSGNQYDTYGIKFVKGSLEELTVQNGVSYYYENGTQYYVVPVAYPMASAEDIYGNMFAVSTTTLSVERSMQIITYLNTNVEMRNLLQYGIEGQHYIFDENGKVTRLEDKNGKQYTMDIYATGNAFLAYPEPGMNESIWENGKAQNRDSLVEPLLGFNLSEYAQTATQFGAPVTVKSGKPYSTTFRSGLSKEVLSQNAVLKAWIEECDKQEPGIFVFRSREKTVNNEYSEILYFYNTTGAYRFGVETEEVTKESGTGYYRNNTYTYTTDLNVSGNYTLTMVRDLYLIRYEGQYKFVQREESKDGKGTETSRTDLTYTETFKYTDTKFDFDLYDTDSYTLNVYGDLYLSHFYENKVLYNKLAELYKKHVADAKTKSVSNQYLSWSESNGDKTVHHFVIYRPNITHTTTTDVVPALFGNKLTLYINNEEYGADSYEIVEPDANDVDADPAKKYTLYYITVETANNVKVSLNFNISKMNEEEKLTGAFKHHDFISDGKGTETAIEETVDFRVYGLLNTELIKYMAELNDQIVALLEGCKTYAELEQMVSDLSVLMNTEEEYVSLYKALPNCNTKLKKFFEDQNGLIKNNMRTFFYQLGHITNYNTMDQVAEYGLVANEVGEKTRQVYFYSPYGIYYLWMQEYQYLPTSMQNAQ